ncbi:MAG: TetR family transcriptional regulator, partial [Micromonosporaceae bacterium]|nr:TetR family transcriptional regulator [Micromonosporaceae bacterium]
MSAAPLPVPPTRGRRRMPADDRRRQLVGLGLQMLTEVPIQDLSVDKVAAAAGISRGLLFHYFPTKRDFYIAVVRAAA